VALNRHGPDRAEALAQSGADIVVDDGWLIERDVAGARPMKTADLAALEHRLQDAAPALIVDYEGTLEPKDGLPGDDPRARRLRRVLARVAQRHPTAVISECDLAELRDRLDVPGIIYAASDGREVELPDGRRERRRPDSPATGWDRAEALQHLLDLLGLAEDDRVIPVYVGDDAEDEDAFAAVDERGIGISVGRSPRATIARFTLPDHDAVHRLLAWFGRK
jgi:trehalose-6-phosphatase